VLTASNWHFNEKACKANKDLQCTPKDCKISIKLASTTFTPKASNANVTRKPKNYTFDKNGLCVDYWSFRALVSEGIPDHFWREIERKYAESSGLTLASGDEVSDPNLHLPLSSPSPSTSGTKKSAGKTPLSRKRKAVTYIDEVVGNEGEEEAEEEEVQEEEEEEEEEERSHQRKLVKKLLMAPPPPPPPPPPVLAPGTSGKKTTKR